MLDIANYNPKTAALTTQPRLNYYKYAQLLTCIFSTAYFPNQLLNVLVLSSVYTRTKKVKGVYVS